MKNCGLCCVVWQVLQSACRERALPAPTADLLLLEASVRFAACPSHPISVLSPLLRCLAVAGGAETGATFALPRHHALALVQLGGFYLQLGYAKHATALIRGAMPKIMEHASAAERGKAMLLLAKCQLTQLHQVIAKLSQQLHQAILRQVTRSLECALRYLGDGFGSREDLCEATYLLARTYAALPLQTPESASKCEAAAASFLNLRVAVAAS